MLTDHPGVAARLDDSHCALVPTTMSASRISSLIRSLNLACLMLTALASGRSSHDRLRAWTASSIGEPNKSLTIPAMGALKCFIKLEHGIPPRPIKIPLLIPWCDSPRGRHGILQPPMERFGPSLHPIQTGRIPSILLDRQVAACSTALDRESVIANQPACPFKRNVRGGSGWPGQDWPAWPWRSRKR